MYVVRRKKKRKNFIKLHLNLILNKFDDYYYLFGSRNRISIKILNFYFNALILIYHQIIVTRIIKSNTNIKLLFYYFLLFLLLFFLCIVVAIYIVSD